MQTSATYQVLEDALEVIVEWTNLEQLKVELFRHRRKAPTELVNIVGVDEYGAVRCHSHTGHTCRSEQSCTQSARIVRADSDSVCSSAVSR